MMCSSAAVRQWRAEVDRSGASVSSVARLAGLLSVRGNNGARHLAQSIINRLQIVEAVLLVRLEMAAFGPFVPGVDQDDTLCQVAVGRLGLALDQGDQPVPKGLAWLSHLYHVMRAVHPKALRFLLDPVFRVQSMSAKLMGFLGNMRILPCCEVFCEFQNVFSVVRRQP